MLILVDAERRSASSASWASLGQAALAEPGGSGQRAAARRARAGVCGQVGKHQAGADGDAGPV
jgi:hypothetical protein